MSWEDNAFLLCSRTVEHFLREKATKEANLAGSNVLEPGTWPSDGAYSQYASCAETDNHRQLICSQSLQSVERHRAGRMNQVKNIYGILPGKASSKSWPMKITPSAPIEIILPKSSRSKTCAPRYLTSACIRPSNLPVAKSARMASKKTAVQVAPQTNSVEEPWKIMRPQSTMVVQLENGMERIPPQTWLVVEVTPPVQGQGSKLSIVGCGYTLFAAAGQGDIVGEVSFREIPKEHITTSTAEANLRFAGRGSSVLALRHAAYIINLLADAHTVAREPRCPIASRAADIGGLSSCEATLALRPCDVELQKLSELKTYAQRLEPIVAHSSSQKENRHLISSLCSPLKHESNAALNRQSCLDMDEPKKEPVSKGKEAHDDFRRFLRQKFHNNTLSAWRALDQNGKMSLGELEFYRACIAIGYQGMTKELWRYLDHDTSGIVTLLELDPDIGIPLAQFKGWAEKTFGRGVAQVFHNFDVKRDGRLTRAEFVQGCARNGYKSGVKIFNLLDRSGLAYVTLDDLEFLDRWHPPTWLFSEPDPEALINFKRRLTGLFGGSALRAWRHGLDRDGTMRVSYQEFKESSHRLVRQSKQGESFENLEGVWRALDADFSGYISLREFDTNANDILSAFRNWAVAGHRTVACAFRAMDKYGSGRVRLKDLKWSCHPAISFEMSHELFRGLVPRDGGFIEFAHVRFLDQWETQDMSSYQESNRISTMGEKTFNLAVMKAQKARTDRREKVDDSVYVDTQLRKLFDLCDEDGNNLISPEGVFQALDKSEEVAELLHCFLGMNTDSKGHVRKFFRDNFDGKEEVSYDEVKEHCRLTKHRPEAPSSLIENEEEVKEELLVATASQRKGSVESLGSPDNGEEELLDQLNNWSTPLHLPEV